jgi:hypothetical protein
METYHMLLVNDQLLYTHPMEYRSTIKRNKLWKHATNLGEFTGNYAKLKK